MNDWTKPLPDNWRDKYADMSRTEILKAWDEANTALKNTKANEAELRKFIVEKAFPTPEVGTNNLEIGGGWVLKAVFKNNYNIDQKLIDDAIDRIEKIGNEGQFIAERIVKPTYDLVVSEYNKLDVEIEAQKKVKDIIGEVLTIKPGMPSLEIVKPKEK